MTIADVVKNFEQLARLCPYLVPTKEQRAHRRLEMFRPKISLAIESTGGQRTTTSECVQRAFRGEHRFNQVKEKRARAHKDRKKYNRKTNIDVDQVQDRNRGKNNRQQNKRKGIFSKTKSPTRKKESTTISRCAKYG